MTDRPDRPPSSRLALIVVGAALVLIGAVTLFGLLSGSDREQATTRFEGVTQLELDLSAASLTVRVGDDDEVVVDKEVSTGLFGGSSAEEQNGSRLRVVKRCPPVFAFGCGGTYLVTVPASLEVTGGTSNGPIRIDGLEGTVDVATSNGAVEINGISGDLTVRTSNGRIEGTDLSSSSVRASTSNGRIQLHLSTVPTSLEARTSNGDVEIVVPDDAPALAVSASTSNGSTNTEIRTDPDAEATLEISTSNGDITVRYP